jgi:hypothetical protein
LSGLSDLFNGRIGAADCVSMLLSLKSPKTARTYLIEKHKQINCYSDSYTYILDRWKLCPTKKLNNIKPIVRNDLQRSNVTMRIGDIMSFDISRFIDYFEGYEKVAYDVKPVMLHYSAIYLLDFFSRTWLHCGSSTGHGLIMVDDGAEKSEEIKVQISKKGFFSRIIDSFYIMNQSSLFSNDDETGFQKYLDSTKKEWLPNLEKKRYVSEPKISLSELLNNYDMLKNSQANVTMANKILTGYLALFLISSISRYKAKFWFEIRNDRNLNSKIELIYYDFTSLWLPELLLQRAIFKLLNEVG